MKNTHYNVIDTLSFAFGQQKLTSIFTQTVKFVERLPPGMPMYEAQPQVLEYMRGIEELKGAHMGVRYTLLDCITFAVSEGMVGNTPYGFGVSFSPTTDFLRKLGVDV